MEQHVKTDYNAERVEENNTIKIDVAELQDGINFAQLLIDRKISTTKRFIRSSNN